MYMYVMYNLWVTIFRKQNIRKSKKTENDEFQY